MKNWTCLFANTWCTDVRYAGVRIQLRRPKKLSALDWEKV